MQQAAIPAPYRDVWSVLDRYGLPVAILGVMFWFGYRVLWPFMMDLVKADREMWKAQLSDSQNQIKAQTAAFLSALDKQHELMRVEFDKLHERLEREYRDHRTENKG